MYTESDGHWAASPFFTTVSEKLMVYMTALVLSNGWFHEVTEKYAAGIVNRALG